MQEATRLNVSAMDQRPGRVLFVAAALHVCNDAFFAVIYPLLPFIAAELALSYTDVGLLKTVFSASSAFLQLPAGLFAERWGEYLLLTWGNGWVAVGLLGMAAATTFPLLLGITALAGLGGNAQHPLASSMVARAFEGGRRSTALGTLNFAGDLGKMIGPALAALITIVFGWRATLAALGIFGVVFSVGIALARPWARPPGPTLVEEAAESEPGRLAGLPPAYWLLAAVGLLDGTTRGASLTFLPFVFEGRGVDAAGVSLLFGVLFAGGAAGKFLCGVVGDRFGPFAVIVVTEALTAFALLGLLGAPIGLAIALAAIFGFALNGTSSVLYAAVAGVVPEGRRGRGYGLFYTLALSGSSLAPLAYGLVADRSSLDWTLTLMAALTLAIIPLAVPLRRHLRV